VPIPARADEADATSTVAALFRQLHDEVRGEVSGLDDDGLNWVPAEGANSIATIVTHLVGSEAETLRCVAGVASERGRAGEFAQVRRTVGDVLALLDGADELLRALAPRIDAGRLRADLALPTLPAGELRSGLTWLVGNYGHAREHLGHVQLTRHLYEAAFPRST
jgi:hypothetical protein